MAAPDAQQYVAQFEQCVAALQTGANAAQATKTLLALREDPRCLEIAQCVLAGSASREAQFHALTLFREGALQRWASLGAPQRSGAAELALDFAARLDPAAEPFVSAAALRAFAALWARGFTDAARGPKEATRALARDALAKVKAAAGDRGDVLCNALGALVQQFSGLENTLGVAKGLRDAARQRVETQALFDVAKIAFGALRACAATPGDVPRDAAAAAELAEQVLGWDFSGAGDALTARVAPPAPWKALLADGSPLDACAALIERCPPGHAARRPARAAATLLASARGEAVVANEAAYRRSAAACATRVAASAAAHAAAARTFDDAVAELRSAADLVSAVFGAAGGASQVAADVLGPLLEASARNCDWVASRCVERAAAATAAVVDAARQRTNHGLIARAAAAADDADAALDEGLAPLLEAWALVAGDEAVVLYDAAAAEGSNAQPPWLHAVVAEVGASVFGRYARCRVEAARAQAAAGVLGELEEDASADDVAAGDARERLETAAAVGRRHVAASCRALDELLTTALERVGALGAATDALEVDATLEEVVVLADLAGALLADDDGGGETVAVPLAIAAAARRDGDAAGAAAALLQKVLALVQNDVRRPSSPAVAACLAAFLARLLAAYARAPDAPPGPLGDFAAAAPQVVAGALGAAAAWLAAWRAEPAVVAGCARLITVAATARRGALAGDAAAADATLPLLEAHGAALIGDATPLAAGFRRAPPALRADAARACGDLALALDALGARHFEALSGAVARALADALRADDGDGADAALRCYAGLGGASAAQGFDGAGAAAARRLPGDAVAAMVDPLLRDLEARPRRPLASAALAAVGATLAAQLPYASPDARRALFAAAPRAMALCAADRFGLTGDADAAHDDLDEALRVVDALVSDDLFGDDDGADAVGAGLACLGFLVPNLDADLLCRRADAARKFYGSVAAAVDAAPERVAGHASLGAVVPALHFGYGLPDAVAARAALSSTRGLAAYYSALDGAARGAAAETWLACAGALLRPLLAHAGAVWDRADDAADALLALFAAADGAAPAAVAAAVAPADGAAAAQLGEDVAALAAHAAQLLRSAGAPSLAAALRRRETRRLWRDAFAAFLTKARGYLIQS